MNIRIYRLVFAFVIAAFTFPLQAADQHGSSEEAVALVKKAIDFYKKNGAEKPTKRLITTTPHLRIRIFIFLLLTSNLALLWLRTGQIQRWLAKICRS